MWAGSKNTEFQNAFKLKLLIKIDYYKYKLLYVSLMITTMQKPIVDT